MAETITGTITNGDTLSTSEQSPPSAGPITSTASDVVFTGTYFNGIVLSNPTTQNPATVAATGYVTNQGTAGDAVYGTNAAAWNFTNLGTIKATAATATGVYLKAGGSVTNGGFISAVADGVVIGTSAGSVTNSGAIQGANLGVWLKAGGAVTNSGTVAGTGTSGDGITFGTTVGGTGTLVNDGTITGNNLGVWLDAGGNVTNAAGALISGTNNAIAIENGTGRVVNLGTIENTTTATPSGIYLQSAGTVTNGAANDTTALIQSHNRAVMIGFEGGAGTVVNFGTIITTQTAATRFTVELFSGGTVTNYGTIISKGTASGTGAIQLDAGGSVTNGSTADRDALISAVDGRAISIGGTAGGSGTVTNFGTIVTNVTATTSLLVPAIYLGAGGTVTNYGLISGAQPPTTAGSQGIITTHHDYATIRNFGTISPTNISDGIHLDHGGTIINGATNATGALIRGSLSGIDIGEAAYSSGARGTLINYGTILSAGTFNNAVLLNAGGSVTNGASGATAALIDGVWIGVNLANVPGTVTNFGTIKSTATFTNPGGVSGTLIGVGVILNQGGSVINGATGSTGALITGYALGVYIGGGAGTPHPGAVGTLINYGTVASTGTNAVAAPAAELSSGGTITNFGTIESTASSAVHIKGTVAGTVSNFGVIENFTTLHSAIYSAAGGIVTNTAGALITSPRTAISFNDTVGTTVSFGTVVNAGVIESTGVTTGSGVYFGQGGLLTNQAGGLITSSLTGVSLKNTSGTVANFGTITSAETGTAGAGVYLGARGIVTNGASGATAALISANHTGVSLKNTAGTVVNFGTVVSTAPLSGASGSGVYLGAGGEITNAPGASISALRAAVSIGNTLATSAAAYIDNQGALTGNIGVTVGGVDTGNNTLTNAGSIIGTGGTAVAFGSGNDLLIDDPGAVFSGSVDGGAGNNTLELASGSMTGTLTGLGTSFVDFATVRINSAAVWQVSDAAGAAPAFVNDGTVLVTGGNMLELGAVIEDAGNSGVIGVGSSGVAEFQSTVAAGQTLSFLDTTGTAKLDDSAQFGATIAGFAVGDTIDLVDTPATSLVYSGGTLTVMNSSAVVAALTIAGSYVPSQFVLSSDGHGGNQITLTPPPPTDIFEFVFTYNDGKDYDDGTVADNGTYGYHAGETVTTASGQYDIFAQAGATSEPAGTVFVTYYSHGGAGQASYTPIETSLGRPDGSNGLESERDSILGTDGTDHPFSPSMEASFTTSPLYGFVFNYSGGAAYYYGTVADNGSSGYAAIANSASPYLTVSDGYYYIFSEGVTGEASGTVIINGYRDGGNATTYPTTGNGSAGLGSESGSFLVDGTQFNFSPTQEATDPPPVGTTADMILRDAGNGNYEIYDIGGNSILGGYSLGQVGTDYQFAGLGNFSASDTTDMILRSATTGAFEVYDISNNNITSAASLGQVGLEWQVAGSGNFNGPGTTTDMMLRDSNTGTFELYDISSNSITSANAIGQVGLEWQVAGFGDFTGDGTTDMLLRDTNTGAFEVYDINNSQLTSASSLGQVGNEWQVAGFGDFNGDGTTDMMLRDTVTGVFELYDINNNRVTSAAPIGQVGLEWQVAGFGPFNGAGTSDMVLRDVNNGAFEVYDIANNQLTGAASLGQIGLEYQVGGFAVDPPTSSQSIDPLHSQFIQATAGFAPQGAASTASLFDGTRQEPNSQLFAAPVHSMM